MNIENMLTFLRKGATLQMFANKKQLAELTENEKEEQRQKALSRAVKSLIDSGDEKALRCLLNEHLPPKEFKEVWKRACRNEVIAELFAVPEEMVALQGARLCGEMII